jgi:hypothetical protein
MNSSSGGGHCIQREFFVSHFVAFYEDDMLSTTVQHMCPLYVANDR